jgi:hypothetical protein
VPKPECFFGSFEGTDAIVGGGQMLLWPLSTATLVAGGAPACVVIRLERWAGAGGQYGGERSSGSQLQAYGPDGEQAERADWFRARVGGGHADYGARELRKGSRAQVRGRLEIGAWTTRDGEQRTSYDITRRTALNPALR